MLMAVLLFAQWIGLAHRIDHGPLASLHMDASDGQEPEAEHSCLAFDAATVADAIGLPPFATPPIASAKLFALWVAFASWDPPFSPCFSSRAPPVS